VRVCARLCVCVCVCVWLERQCYTDESEALIATARSDDDVRKQCASETSVRCSNTPADGDLRGLSLHVAIV
jgi:hypothetical protein